jgi:arylsulfatase
VSWPARIEAQGEPRQQYTHAVDVVPTIYELLEIEPPETIGGYPQSEIEGESFAASLTDPEAPGKQTQYYAMLGQRSIYDSGWLACTLHPPLSGWGKFEQDVWELYHLESDRAQSTNLAEREPERLEQLKSLWFYYAGIYNGLPLDDRTALEQVLAERPHAGVDRERYVYYPNAADVPEEGGVRITGRPYTIAAGVELESSSAEGVIYAHGGVAGGHSLYVQDGRLRYAFNWVGTHLQEIVADRELAPGRQVLSADFSLKGPSSNEEMPGFEGTLRLYVDDEQVGEGELVTQPGVFCLVGDGICVGRDSASPVTPSYKPPFRFTGGTIDKVVVDVSGKPYIDHEAQVRAWFMRD